MRKEIFNEMDFIKREYVFLRMLTFTEELSEEVAEKMASIQNEALKNVEAQKYAIGITEDIFTIKQLNGPVTIACMLLELEKINPEISNQLMENLLFEYQDNDKKVPFILTGDSIFSSSYLEFLLGNHKYTIDKKYNRRISECVIQKMSCMEEREFNGLILTLFFERKDISIEHKKFVIDSLDEDLLYRLVNEWNEAFMEAMVDNLNLEALDLSDEETEKIEKELEDMHEEKVSSFIDVVDLINKKLYS